MLLDGIDMWDHQVLTSVGYQTGALRLSELSSPKASRGAVLNQEKRNTTIDYNKREVNSLRLTLILRITVTTLPFELLGSMAVVTVEEHLSELLQRIVKNSFFEDVEKIDCHATEELMNRTLSPISSPSLKEKLDSSDSEANVAQIGALSIYVKKSSKAALK